MISLLVSDLKIYSEQNSPSMEDSMPSTLTTFVEHSLAQHRDRSLYLKSLLRQINFSMGLFWVLYEPTKIRPTFLDNQVFQNLID